MMIDYITTIIEACLALFHHSHASEKGKGDAVGTTTDRDGYLLTLLYKRYEFASCLYIGLLTVTSIYPGLENKKLW
jgi:hypothetical protein